VNHDDPEVVAEVRAAFDAYEAALNSNDVEALDGFFWAAAQTVRYGVGESLYGFAAIREFRRHRPGGSPPRKLQNTVIATFGRNFATTSTEFRRLNGQGRLGRQSQTWVRMPEGWRIVAAHVSLMGDSH
jgi:hypothetical protein